MHALKLAHGVGLQTFPTFVQYTADSEKWEWHEEAKLKLQAFLSVTFDHVAEANTLEFPQAEECVRGFQDRHTEPKENYARLDKCFD